MTNSPYFPGVDHQNPNLFCIVQATKRISTSCTVSLSFIICKYLQCLYMIQVSDRWFFQNTTGASLDRSTQRTRISSFRLQASFHFSLKPCSSTVCFVGQTLITCVKRTCWILLPILWVLCVYHPAFSHLSPFRRLSQGLSHDEGQQPLMAGAEQAPPYSRSLVFFISLTMSIDAGFSHRSWFHKRALRIGKSSSWQILDRFFDTKGFNTSQSRESQEYLCCLNERYTPQKVEMQQWEYIYIYIVVPSVQYILFIF